CGGRAGEQGTGNGEREGEGAAAVVVTGALASRDGVDKACPAATFRPVPRSLFPVPCSRHLASMPHSPPQTFLIDGYALIYRAFFALISRPLRTSRGENTSAAWGVVNFLLRLRAKYQPDYLVWV